jgi:PKD repeat protein
LHRGYNAIDRLVAILMLAIKSSALFLTLLVATTAAPSVLSAWSTFNNHSFPRFLTAQHAVSLPFTYAQIPPQAAFTYYPPDSYVNMPITFDASASVAEGYNVTIVNYQWDFGDGSPKVNMPSAVTSHEFTVVNSYTVTLEVTDSQGLWSTASKIIAILPPSGPKADFTWRPSTPKPGQATIFDATATKLGWNGTVHPTIANYVWNFGDGNTTSGLYSTIVHVYSTIGNYTVKLSVTDTNGLTSNVSYVVRVEQNTLVGDINGDGTVDISDAILLSSAYGSTPGDPNWNPSADLNGDGTVDLLDAIILSAHYG